MHKLTFYPLGNADSCLIQSSGKKAVLIDYADMRNPDDSSDKRCDLPSLLRKALKDMDRKEFDVVAFTHVDNDHICGSSEFFHFEWAKKYQGGDRLKIREMWVPAAAILETGLEGEAEIIRQEARHRLIEGKGIRVFSRPDALKEWLKGKGIELNDRKSLISDAGTLAPTFTLAADAMEFFVHAPFATRLNENDVVDRNNDALVLQATFQEGAEKTRLFLGADIDSDVLAEIVEKTEAKGRYERLQNDVVEISHHCSYRALNKDDKGDEQTKPVPAVARFFEEYGRARIIFVSTSKPIPPDDEDAQPPHRQAANYYESVANNHAGQFRVTMEWPSKSSPKPMVVEISAAKAKVVQPALGAAAIISGPAPRAGKGQP